MTKIKNQGRVYSTEFGKCCPGCGRSFQQCSCSSEKTTQTNDGIVRVSRQTKGRKGSGVCLISGVPLADKELRKLAKDLKKRCGTGGTVKNGVIEIQGDHRDVLVEALKALGFKAKIAGG